MRCPGAAPNGSLVPKAAPKASKAEEEAEFEAVAVGITVEAKLG